MSQDYVGANQLRSSRFRAEREANWRRLEDLVTMAERRGLRRMSFEQARDLAGLYRDATSSLAIAREISLDKALLAYLEALTARAYLVVYAPQLPVGGLARRFLSGGASQAIRRSWLFVLIGFASMALGTLAGWLLYAENAAWYYVVMPEGLSGGRGPDATTAYLRSIIYSDGEEHDGLTAFATYLFSHNTRIAMFAFGLGMFFCAPAMALAFYNGVILGAFVALHVERGLGWDLFGWLSIHGVTEISAICIATGAGVQLGAALLFPGNRRRSTALREAGRDATKLALVAALMLLAAAVLEGFGRQLIQNPHWRIGIGWGIGGVWIAWFLLAGRRRRWD